MDWCNIQEMRIYTYKKRSVILGTVSKLKKDDDAI